jgi:CheY-like chemotaxis protein
MNYGSPLNPTPIAACCSDSLREARTRSRARQVTDAAITAMTENRPDLILTSTLLSANDDRDLIAHLRATPSLRHLPTLTIPPVVEAPATEARSTD